MPALRTEAGMTEITVRLSEEDRRAIVEEIVSKLAERQDTSSPDRKSVV